MRLLRLDDYPHGRPGYGPLYRSIVSQALAVFNNYNIPYILGVSPLLIDENDARLLNQIVKSGWVCMHGFNHKFDHSPWSTITSTWPLGGEFAGLAEEAIEERYSRSEGILNRVRRYDSEHFVAPFNCYTQEAINVLHSHGVKYLHTCDKEYDLYGYDKLDYKGMTPVVSKYHKTYDYANCVINHLDDPSQITLHWIFDSENPGWLDDYRTLAMAIALGASKAVPGVRLGLP